MTVALVGIRCRTSDRTAAGSRGVDALAPLLGKRLGREPRMIGTPGEPREARFDEDIAASRGCLLEAGGQVDDALSGGNFPLLVAGDCSICLTTLSTALRWRPDARVLWLDAHGDYNTPATTQSGFLGGMCLAGACGEWDAGVAEPIPPERVVLAGVRDLDPAERELLERSDAAVIGASAIETLVAAKNALGRSPVYAHLDLDVLDREALAAGGLRPSAPSGLSPPAAGGLSPPAAGGLSPEKLYDLLEAVTDECELVGLEVTAFEAPEDEQERQAAADTVMYVLEPLLEAIPEEAHVSG